MKINKFSSAETSFIKFNYDFKGPEGCGEKFPPFREAFNKEFPGNRRSDQSLKCKIYSLAVRISDVNREQEAVELANAGQKRKRVLVHRSVNRDDGSALQREEGAMVKREHRVNSGHKKGQKKREIYKGGYPAESVSKEARIKRESGEFRLKQLAQECSFEFLRCYGVLYSDDENSPQPDSDSGSDSDYVPGGGK